MSWLFAALIPGLLMLATFGLERLESSLGNVDRTDEIDELVAQTPTECGPGRASGAGAESVVGPAAANAHLHGHATFTGLAALEDEPGLPTGCADANRAIRSFSRLRHANPV